MPAGTAPIYIATPKAPRVKLTAANVKSDGQGTVGTDMFLLYTAGANGGFVSKIRFTVSGSTSGAASAATVARVYLSTLGGTSVTTSADTFRIDEVAIPAINTDQVATQTQPYEVILNQYIAPNETVLVSTHVVPPANTVMQAFALGTGDY